MNVKVPTSLLLGLQICFRNVFSFCWLSVWQHSDDQRKWERIQKKHPQCDHVCGLLSKEKQESAAQRSWSPGKCTWYKPVPHS